MSFRQIIKDKIKELEGAPYIHYEPATLFSNEIVFIFQITEIAKLDLLYGLIEVERPVYKCEKEKGENNE